MRTMRWTWLCSALLSLTLVGAAPLRADEKGDAILREAFEKLHAATTMTADITVVINLPGAPAPQTLKGTVAAMKPNFFRFETQGQRAQSFFADGKDYFIYAAAINQYIKQPLDPKPTVLRGMWEGEIDAFFGGVKNLENVETTHGGTEKVGDVDCDLVKVQMKDPNRSVVYAVGKADRFIYRATLTFPLPNEQSLTQTNTLSNIKLNVPKTAADFEFKPPAGAKLFEPPKRPELLSVGEQAPDFELPMPGGGRLSLSAVRKEKKAVLINFWFYN